MRQISHEMKNFNFKWVRTTLNTALHFRKLRHRTRQHTATHPRSAASFEQKLHEVFLIIDEKMSFMSSILTLFSFRRIVNRLYRKPNGSYISRKLDNIDILFLS